jgi:hypothetical protein
MSGAVEYLFNELMSRDWGGTEEERRRRSGYVQLKDHAANAEARSGYYLEYSQSTGQMWYVDSNGAGLDLVGIGYSGRGIDINNPASQNLVGRGPLPEGAYELAPMRNNVLTRSDGSTWTANDSMRLIPDGTNVMFGRTNFLIHGGSYSPGPLTSSQGCIILRASERRLIGSSGLSTLRVIN